MKQNEALSNYISNFFSMHPARRDLFVEMILSLVKAGSAQQHKIAKNISSNAKVNSIIRRIQRFFEEQVISMNAVARLLFNLFELPEKITLTMDRTNWKIGIIDVNFLVIGFLYNGYTIPLQWILLPHRGNSAADVRIQLLESIFEIIPPERIDYLLADREFIGAEWFQFLAAKNIAFCIRIKENMLIMDTRSGGTIKLSEFFKYLTPNQFREIQQRFCGIDVRIFGTRTQLNEFLILAVFDDGNLNDPFELYRNRWGIECMFKSMKSAGFNFEDTHQKDHQRLSKMMALIAIAYAWSIKIGEIKNAIKPISIKKHERKEFSLFTYGFRAIQILLSKPPKIQKKFLLLLEKIALKLAISPDLAEITVVY